MKYHLIGLTAAAFLSTSAFAQAPTSPPPTASPTPSTPSSPSTSPTSASKDRSGGDDGGYGAWIELKGPNGAEISVRCAEGETTDQCMESVGKLIDKVKSMRPDDRMERSGRGDEGDRRGDWDRGERPRGRY